MRTKIVRGMAVLAVLNTFGCQVFRSVPANEWQKLALEDAPPAIRIITPRQVVELEQPKVAWIAPSVPLPAVSPPQGGSVPLYSPGQPAMGQFTEWGRNTAGWVPGQLTIGGIPRSRTWLVEPVTELGGVVWVTPIVGRDRVEKAVTHPALTALGVFGSVLLVGAAVAAASAGLALATFSGGG